MQTQSNDWPADCEYRQVFRAHGKAGTGGASKVRTLHDAPYEFGEQRMYRQSPDTLVAAGDSISLTCSFWNQTSRPLIYGESSDDEMCFLTLWAWPAGSISNASPLTAALGVAPDQGCF